MAEKTSETSSTPSLNPKIHKALIIWSAGVAIVIGLSFLFCGLVPKPIGITTKEQFASIAIRLLPFMLLFCGAIQYQGGRSKRPRKKVGVTTRRSASSKSDDLDLDDLPPRRRHNDQFIQYLLCGAAVLSCIYFIGTPISSVTTNASASASSQVDDGHIDCRGDSTCVEWEKTFGPACRRISPDPHYVLACVVKAGTRQAAMEGCGDSDECVGIFNRHFDYCFDAHWSESDLDSNSRVERMVGEMIECIKSRATV